MRPVLLLAATASALGCGSACPAVAAPSPRSEPAAEAAAVNEAPPGFALRLRFAHELADGVDVECVARSAEGLDTWSALPGFSAVRAEDRDGALGVEVDGGELRFDRDVVPPLTIRYRLEAPAHFTEALWLGPWSGHVDGRALLLPPDAPSATIAVTLEGHEAHSFASSLGLGAEHRFETRPFDLSHVTFAVGQVDHAVFEAREGHDVVASIGQRNYDPRWVGAEIALLRTVIDEYFAVIDPRQHVSLLVSRPAGPRVPPFAPSRSGIGLRVLVREDASWTGPARLAMAQVLSRRWLGGHLRFVGPDGSDERWASLGFTRWIAARTLVRLGTLTTHELARELTMLEGAVALNVGGELESMARGALYAGALDGRLRRRTEAPRNLQGLLFPMLRELEVEPGPRPRARFEAALREALGEEEVTRFREQVLGAAAVSGTETAFGPCLRRQTRGVHRHFALGFEAPDGHAEEVIVSGVVRGGAAYEAGLRDGARVRDLRYTDGDPDTPVRLTRVEDGRSLEWRAYDREARGPTWTRTPRLDEERCAF